MDGETEVFRETIEKIIEGRLLRPERKDNMKKSVQLFTSLILAAGMLAGCGSTSGNQGSASASSSQETTQTSAVQASASTGETADSEENTTSAAGNESTASASENTDAAQAGTASSSNVLVVYYSATGNTAAVAQTIANETSADVFEITPAQPYTDDDLNWSDSNSRVSREHEDESLQNQVELTTTTVDNWDSYNTVFIGYPIWWGIAAWPVNQFVQNNDFTGKTVIPFCTSSSSGIGESGENLAEMAGTGDWQEGQRFSSHPDESEVTSWAQSVIAQ